MAAFSVPGLISRFAGRMTSGALFWVTLALLAISVIVPDPLPFVDEIVLALAALMLSRRRGRTVSDEAPDVGAGDAASEATVDRVPRSGTSAGG